MKPNEKADYALKLLDLQIVSKGMRRQSLGINGLSYQGDIVIIQNSASSNADIESFKYLRNKRS